MSLWEIHYRLNREELIREEFDTKLEAEPANEMAALGRAILVADALAVGMNKGTKLSERVCGGEIERWLHRVN
jgi:hypothetical protein